jgi:glycogen synthase
MTEKIAFVTYETPFAPCGGIAAVMGRLPKSLHQASGTETVVITPYHHQIERTTALKVKQVGLVKVPLESQNTTVNVCQYEDDDKRSWYLVMAEDKRLFAGRRHPYDVGNTQEAIARNLRRDSLFFGAAVSRSLDVIAPGVRWTLLMQDWEAATTALAMSGQNSSHRLFLTLHNSYDSGGIDEPELRNVGIDPSKCQGPPGTSSASVLERALPLTIGPIFTVSEQFASDLTEDKLQVEVMVPHLQKMLKPRLHGVDNGPFADLAISDEVLGEATRGNFKPLQDWKSAMREEAFIALNEHRPSEDEPVWGDLGKFSQDDAPWFVMAGRDDTRQKGYDVAVLAIKEFLEKGGDARFLFFPIPGDEGKAGLSFLKQLAEEHPERVVALPFRFRAGYFAALHGATYGIMPSLYEPFGMANEFYLNGTAGIGRATGGILQQIVPLHAASAFSSAVQTRANRWHTASAYPTGILYREKDDISSAIDDWDAINAAAYNRGDNPSHRVCERKQYPLFRSMVNELRVSIVDGVRVYQNRPQFYYRMITEGITYIRRSFSWERAASEYARNLV